MNLLVKTLRSSTFVFYFSYESWEAKANGQLWQIGLNY